MTDPHATGSRAATTCIDCARSTSGLCAMHSRFWPTPITPKVTGTIKITVEDERASS
jgi:hypothetical protein